MRKPLLLPRRLESNGIPKLELDEHRYFFINADAEKLIQFQPSRFLFNWRSTPKQSVKYPRFPKLFSEFSKHWEYVVKQLGAQKSKYTIDILELSYVNHIYWDDIGRNADISDILTFVTPSRKHKGFVGLNYSLKLESKDCRGFILISLKSAQRKEDCKDLFIFQIDLIGKQKKQNEPISDWFDRARGEILNTFLSLTTNEAKKIWGRN